MGLSENRNISEDLGLFHLNEGTLNRFNLESLDFAMNVVGAL